MELLGLDTRGNYKDGPLQDVHWPEGCSATSPAIRWARCTPRSGSPPCAVRCPTWTRASAAGDLAPVFDWLRDNIWSQASRWTTDELAQRASGER
jgi:carboxypeptidase Taq